jgi:hypothetical protein
MKIIASILLSIFCAGRCLTSDLFPEHAPAPRVDSLPTLLSITSGNDARPGAAALDEVVVLRVGALRTLLERSSKDRSPVVLIIDGLPLRGASPSSIVPDKDELSFLLQSSGPARALWDKFLQTRGRDRFFTQDALVTAGLENGTMTARVLGEVPNFSLVLIRRPIFYFCIAVTLFLFVIFHIVAYKSDLLRDSGTDPAVGRKPYSLSRTQMALWFFVVIVSFLMLWVETGRIDTMPFSVVILLGISAVTALGAGVIDVHRSSGAPQERSDDFLFDILSDDHGVCIHRFQMAGWTIVLVVVFLYTVFTEMRMPDFDASILLLMGLSSGTYIGYKVPSAYRRAPALAPERVAADHPLP